MANVKFKRGSQASLNTLIGNGVFEDGCFYLTNDTDRLYVAQSNSELVELNKSITVVDTPQDLPTTNVEVGQFYYIAGSNSHTGGNDPGNTGSNGNILAVCTSCRADGTDPHWVQVNPDTNDNDNDHVVGFSIAKDTTKSTASKLVYSWTIEQADVQNNAISPNLTGEFEIVSADISQLAGASVGLSSSAVNSSTNSTVISTIGDGHGTGSVTITGGTNVTLSGNANSINIAATDTKYQQVVSANDKSVTVQEEGGNSIGTTTYTNGTAINVTVTASNSNKDAAVAINHANVTRAADANTATGQKVAGAEITYVTGVTSNAQGHITGVATETINLPLQKAYSIDGVTAYNDGKIGVSLSDGVNSTEVKSDADLYYVVNGTNVYNQGTIDFYTKNDIDRLINDINGMSYKGAIPAGGLPTSGVKVGDTYVVGTAGNYGGHAAKAGDLLIANGTETNGVITSNLSWDLIECGNEFDSQYDLSVANNIISLTSNISGDTPDDIEIAGGNKLTATTANGKITINHDTQTVNGKATQNVGNQTLNYGQTVNVVNGVNADAYGHITDIYTSTLTMPAQPTDTTESFTIDASTGTHGNGVLSLDIDDGGNNKGELTFGNGTLTTAVVTQGASANKGTVVINHAEITTSHTDNTSTNTIISPTNGTNVITGVTADGHGHITGYTTSKIVLPDAALAELGGSITAVNGVSNKASIALSLQKGGNEFNLTGANVPEFTLSSSSLQIGVTAANATTPADVAVDIVWGQF